MEFQPVSDYRAKLGEAPHWSQARQELLFSDIHGGMVGAWKPGTETRLRKVAARSAFLLDTADGGLVFGAEDGFGPLSGLEAADQPSVTVKVEPDLPDTAVNDARCDPQGRLWFGTLDRNPARRPICGLYRWTPDAGLVRMLDAVQISNGLQWSPDGQTFYYVDSWKRRLDAFDFDGASGTIHNRRTLAEIPADEGLPDGMNVDGAGRIYVALYGGGKLKRFLPDGQFDRDITMPVRFPTSLCFGGPDLRQVFVTTSAVGYANTGLAGRSNDDDRGLGGAILTAELDVPGQVSRPMAASLDLQVPRPA